MRARRGAAKKSPANVGRCALRPPAVRRRASAFRFPSGLSAAPSAAIACAASSAKSFASDGGRDCRRWTLSPPSPRRPQMKNRRAANAPNCSPPPQNDERHSAPGMHRRAFVFAADSVAAMGKVAAQRRARVRIFAGGRRGDLCGRRRRRRAAGADADADLRRTSVPATRESGKLFVAETDRAMAAISENGGNLVGLRLKNHLDANGEHFALFEDGRRRHGAQSGLVGGENFPDHRTPFALLNPDAPLHLGDAEDSLTIALAAESGGVRLLKRYIFTRGDDMIRLELEAHNLGDSAASPKGYFQLFHNGALSEQESSFLPTFFGAAVFTDAEKISEDRIRRHRRGAIPAKKRGRLDWIYTAVFRGGVAARRRDGARILHALRRRRAHRRHRALRRNRARRR